MRLKPRLVRTTPDNEYSSPLEMAMVAAFALVFGAVTAIAVVISYFIAVLLDVVARIRRVVRPRKEGTSF